MIEKDVAPIGKVKERSVIRRLEDFGARVTIAYDLWGGKCHSGVLAQGVVDPADLGP